jgi:DNA (cytosine-5)-methyltransferase 1
VTFRVFDGFCKAGGAGEGYARAGATVVSMDIAPQPRNPHDFTLGDVLKVDPGYLRTFDLLHFSSPCQGYTELRHAPGAKGTALRLLPQVRALAKAAGVPYVSENVRAAAWDMINPVRLCGCMFGLGAQGCKLVRERLFECSFPVAQPICTCRGDPRPVIGVYGGHARRRAKSAGGRGTRDEWIGGHRAAASEALGIDWMTLDELSEAIPPAYTQYIARQFLAQKERSAA